MTCSACNGKCETPEACQLPVAIATKPPRVAFLLEPLFTRYPWLGITVLCCVIVIWTCIDGYLEALPQ